MKSCGGVWVAHGSGSADRETVDEKGHVRVPPEDPRYTLRRVWLSKEEENKYYYGFSNEGLWPLCHIAYTRPVFRREDWEAYVAVNQKFADAVLEEIGGRKAFVFIQDYHLALISRMIKEKNPNCITAQFWHIPWPNREAFRVCPWQDDILHGMLGNDLLGFHIQYHCNNFLDTVDRGIEAKVDYERFQVMRGGKTTLVKAFPISVDYSDIAEQCGRPAIEAETKRLIKEYDLRGQIVGFGADRIDYTKGIPDRLRAIDIFFEKNPQYQGKVSFVQIGALSRIHIPQYKEINDEITRMAVDINYKYATGHWKPVHVAKGHFGRLTLEAMYKLSRFCVVSSLHDGMNLVSKEFVAARTDGDGVLILSRFTGASRELTDAVAVNPYAADDFADAVKTAIEMPPEERQKRMARMRETVARNNIYRWAAKIISELLKFEFKEI
jgi:trehalose 6-phosphate synthase